MASRVRLLLVTEAAASHCLFERTFSALHPNYILVVIQ